MKDEASTALARLKEIASRRDDGVAMCLWSEEARALLAHIAALEARAKEAEQVRAEYDRWISESVVVPRHGDYTIEPAYSAEEAKGTARQALAAAPAPALPRLNIRCETTDGHVTGSTYLNVVRVEAEDDGSFTAVTDHWPAAQAAPEKPSEDKRRLDGLRELCGYVEDGSETSVRISQDDATRDWIIRAGKRWWHGRSLRAALDAALARQMGGRDAE